MILDVDIGNTFAKWRRSDSDQIHRQPTHSLDSGWQGLVDCIGIVRIRVASVAGEAVTHQFLERVISEVGIQPELARVSSGVAGVKPCYPDLTRLGVDRWLSMLAAFQKASGSCLVISAGSALTADYLNERGEQLGGAIAPGRQKMLDAVYAGLANVLKAPIIQIENQSIELGQNSEECVLAGVNISMAGFFTRLALKHPAVPIFLAGGDAHAMLSLCAQEHKSRVIFTPNLVLDGLAIALP